MITLDELKKQAEETEGPVCDPCQPEQGAPEKKTTLLLTDGKPRILPRYPSHNIGATRPANFGFTPGIHCYDVMGAPLHVVVEPDGTCRYASLWTPSPDSHLGAVTGDC